MYEEDFGVISSKITRLNATRGDRPVEAFRFYEDCSKCGAGVVCATVECELVRLHPCGCIRGEVL